MYRRKVKTIAARIGCTEDEYLLQLRAGREWCSRCENPDGSVDRWVRSEHMSVNTVSMCQPCQAASVRRRARERAAS